MIVCHQMDPKVWFCSVISLFGYVVDSLENMDNWKDVIVDANMLKNAIFSEFLVSVTIIKVIQYFK